MSKVVSVLDWDEFLYHESWKSNNHLRVKNIDTTTNFIDFPEVKQLLESDDKQYMYVHRWDWWKPESNLIFTKGEAGRYPSGLNQYEFWKSISRPEYVYVSWIHTPTSCYQPGHSRGGRCQMMDSGHTMYVHSR